MVFSFYHVIYFDVGLRLLNFIGFKIGDRGCCGTGKIEVTFLCKIGEVCPNVEDYVFWDSFHPTEKAYRLIVEEIVEQYLKTICDRTELC